MASESSSQPNVRIIPIQVEGRDYVGRNEEPTRKTSSDVPPQPAEPTRVNSGSSMGFGAEIPSSRHHFQPQDRPFGGRMNFNDEFDDDMGFRHGSIFDRAKDFPVRSFFQQEHPNQTRAGSPGKQNPSFTTAGAGQSHSPPKQPAPQQQRAKSPQQQQQQQQQPNKPQQRSHPKQQSPPQEAEPERQKSPTPQPPPPTKMREDSIEKIKKIQKDVLELMDEVEKFQATTRKDKHYLYLDEMLTQNLLRLDTVDTEGKENIKQARREAIKCINHCISVLEAKTEAAETELRNKGGAPTSDNTRENRSQSMEPQAAPSESDNKRPTGSASADNVLKTESTNNNNNINEQSAEIQKSSSQK